jgi:pimeloyl-ACP methyl ester carboxylesterase
VLAALFATLAGVLLALWLRYTGPDTTLSFEIMLDILLIVVIGGMGTMYGAVIGSVLFVLAQNYLQDLLKLALAARSKACPCWAPCSRPTAGCCGWACCSCCRLPLPHRHRRPAAHARAAWPRWGATLHDPHIALPGPVKGREIHVTAWGDPAGRGGDRLARPGAHRARHGRHRRAPGAALARDLPRHPGPRPVAVEPAPDDEYCLGFYAALAASLLDQLGIQQCHWLGTSMGGAIGLRAAARPLRGRIQRLVLNDIGPSWPRPAVERIRSYAGSPPAFATWANWSSTSAPSTNPTAGSATRSGGAHRDLVRRLPDGRVTPHYDPAMVRSSSTTRTTTTSGTPGTPCRSRCCACAAPTVRPAAARCGRSHAQPRPAGGGGHHPRLRPRAGAEHAGSSSRWSSGSSASAVRASTT